MKEAEKKSSLAGESAPDAEPAVAHLRQAILGGQNWFVALLEAIGLWKTAEETHHGRAYRYLIAGEAFDWMLLAERLCGSVPDSIPESESDALLFKGQPPINLSAGKFKELIGAAKYHHYLNYHYGVIAEEALVLAVAEEIRKEKRAWGYFREMDTTNESYRRIYGLAFAPTLRRFRGDKGYPDKVSIDLTELKEFAYWRFQYRLRTCEKAKVASDSRKAVNWLKEHGLSTYLQGQDVLEYFDEPLPDAQED